MNIEHLTKQAYRVLMYDELDEYEEIIQELAQYLCLHPENVNAHNNIGVAYGEVRQIESAHQAFDRAIKEDPGEPIPFVNKGDLYKRIGDYQQAIDCYTTAIGIQEDASFYLCRAYALAELNAFDLALKDFEVAGKLDPQNKATQAAQDKTIKQLNEGKKRER